MHPVGRAPNESADEALDDELDILAKRFENGLMHKLHNGTGIDYAWSLGDVAPNKPVFFICWTYGHRAFVHLGIALPKGPSTLKYSPVCGHTTRMLKDVIKDVLETQPSPELVATIRVTCVEVYWDDTVEPTLVTDGVRTIDVKPSPIPRAARRGRADPPPAGGPVPLAPAEGEDEPSDGGDGVEGDFLEDWLAEGLNEDTLLIDHDEPVSEHVAVVGPGELGEDGGLVDDDGDGDDDD